MAQLNFDFHARPARPGLFSLALLLAGAVAAGWSWQAWQSARDTQAGLALQIAALEQTKPRKIAKPATRGDEVRQRVAAQLAYTWQPAFDTLAAARSNKIALVSLDAVQAKSQVKLVAEARKLADAVEFVDALQQQPGVKRAALFQHEVQRAPKEHPVRFTVVVELGA